MTAALGLFVLLGAIGAAAVAGYSLGRMLGCCYCSGRHDEEDE